MITNYHILTIKYLGQTNHNPSRISIYSERFSAKKVIPFNHDSLNRTLDIAEDWLQKNGFAIVGHGEGKGHYYVITSTFKSPTKTNE